MKSMRWCILFLGLSFLFSQINKAQDASGEGESIDVKAVRKMLVSYMDSQKKEKENESSKELVDLGRVLFYDKRLSHSQNVSCNDCHDLKRYGTNGEYFKELRLSGKAFRDTPSIYNKARVSLYGWDGSVRSLQERTSFALMSEHEMGIQDKQVLEKRLLSIQGYFSLFSKAFPEQKENALSFDNAVLALTAFEKKLLTPAPIDKFIAGDDSALTLSQLKGIQLFEKYYCFSCHTGSNFGGQMIQKAGIIHPWPNQKDLGYFHFTKKEEHKMFFRVPPLRNVSKTAPYFHDFSSRRLSGAIYKMSWHELGKRMSFKDIREIHQFLDTLTGEIPHEFIKKPELPQ